MGIYHLCGWRVGRSMAAGSQCAAAPVAAAVAYGSTAAVDHVTTAGPAAPPLMMWRTVCRMRCSSSNRCRAARPSAALLYALSATAWMRGYGMWVSKEHGTGKEAKRAHCATSAALPPSSTPDACPSSTHPAGPAGLAHWVLPPTLCCARPAPPRAAR